VLVGGFPCQAFSVAGQRKGFEDTRGTLFFEIARIAAEKKPRLLLLENVKGLLSHDNGRTFDVMCAALNEIGYAVDFRVLNSKYFGVPQNRERIFIVADRDAAHDPWTLPKSTDVVTRAKRRAMEVGVRTFNFDWPTEGAVISRLRNVLETEVDEKYYLSEEKTAKLVEQLTENSDIRKLGFIVCDKQQNRVHHTNGVMPTITANNSGGRNPGGLIAEPVVTAIGNVNPSGNGMNGQVYDSNGISPTLTTNKGEGTKITEYTVIQKTHSTCTTVKHDETGTLQAARLDKVPQVVTECRPVLTPDREEKRQNGRRFKDDGEESFTLTAQDKHGVAIGTYPRYRIRKLTPLECWRLQGFPDAAHNAVKSAGVSDSQRYKQAGNAVTVNVILAIGERLTARLPVTIKEAV